MLIIIKIPNPLSVSCLRLFPGFRTPLVPAMTRLSKTFPTRKNPRPISPKASPSPITTTVAYNNHKKEETKATEIASPSSSSLPASSSLKSKAKSKTKVKTNRASQWSVYLIISSRVPKTYVGVTTNFSRRLKQHNGELKGGAKASSAGRPWTLGCIVRGFKDRSEACEFEYKWKSISRKLPRKKSKEDEASNSLLQHREAALSKVKASLNCSHLQIDWKSSSP